MKFPYVTEAGLTIHSAKGAQYSCPDKSHITCTVVVTGGVFGDTETSIPYTAMESGDDATSTELFKHFKSKAKKYVAPEISIFDLQGELDELLIDIKLDLATDEEISRAKELRTQIKAMRG